MARAYSASKYGLRGLSEVLRFRPGPYRIGVSVVVPGAVKTPLVQTVQIAGVDRDDPRREALDGPVQRARGVAEHVADKILAGISKQPVPHLHLGRHSGVVLVQAPAWWPYSVAMRQANVVFTRALRPTPR